MEVNNMIKKFIFTVSCITSIVSGLAVSAIRDSANWWELTKPYFIVWVISTILAVLIYNINYIRRVTYPVIVCISAWAYQHRIIVTRFTLSTYRVYKWKNRSYKQLFGYVQDLFDTVYM